jgi:hypothetical protein
MTKMLSFRNNIRRDQMKKAIVLLIALSLSVVGLMAEGLDELPGYLVLNDGLGATYYCTLTSMTTFGNAIYSIVVNPTGVGLLFVDIPNNAFHIVVFNQGNWLAYAQVGAINKPCATAYNANEMGGLMQVTICLGPSRVTVGDSNPNVRR